jgi:hypothetical protein
MQGTFKEGHPPRGVSSRKRKNFCIVVVAREDTRWRMRSLPSTMVEIDVLGRDILIGGGGGRIV